MTLTAKAGLG